MLVAVKWELAGHVCVAGLCVGMKGQDATPDIYDAYRQKLEQLLLDIRDRSEKDVESLEQLVGEAKLAAQSLTAAPKFLKIVRGKAKQPDNATEQPAASNATECRADRAVAPKTFENVEWLTKLLDDPRPEFKQQLLELLSFLCCADEGGYKAIQYRIQLMAMLGPATDATLETAKEPSGKDKNLSDKEKNSAATAAPFGFGDEYLRTLVSQIVMARADPLSNVQLIDVLPIVRAIAPHWMVSGNELEALDLLYEADMLDSLPALVGDDQVLGERLGPYLVGLAQYASGSPEWNNLLKLAYTIYCQCKLHFQAFQISLLLDNRTLLLKTLAASPPMVAKQIAFACSRHSMPLYLTDDVHQVANLSWGERQSGFYIYMAQELDLLEPKTAEDVCKDPSGWKSRMVDSSLENLGKTLVNCFVNAGFCSDTLFTCEHSNWVFKHKDYAAFTATLLSGLIHLWNVDEGLSVLDTYQYSEDCYVKGGALAGFGLLSCGVWPEADPISTLVNEHLESPVYAVKLGAIMALGLAYAGTCREDLMEVLAPVLLDPSSSMHSGWAALSLGLIFAGSASPDASELLITALLEKCPPATEGTADPAAFKGTVPFLAVSLALVYLTKKDSVELALEATQALPAPVAILTTLLLESFAFAASGDMLKVQKMLQLTVRQTDAVAESEDEESDGGEAGEGNPTSLAALLGIALISLGEPLQEEMAFRLIQQPLSCGTTAEKRAVPLALALISLSNPQNQLISLLSKLTRDSDEVTAMNAVIALGLIGAGTNNSRIAQLLQQQAVVYSRDPAGLLGVRFAQGILHLGKGLLTLNPVHSDGLLVNRVSLAALAALLHLGADFKSFLSEMPYAVSLLGLAIKPRWLVAVDENLDPKAVPVRIGAAVDTLGQAGNPRRISGFQTHSTPVLIGLGQRAELVSGHALSPVLEGIVIVPSTRTDGGGHRHS